MKIVIAMMFTLASCAQWKQKDFEKELTKSETIEVVPQVKTTKADEKILEKFDVPKPAEAPKKETKTKTVAAPVQKKEASKVEASKKAEPKVAAPVATPVVKTKMKTLPAKYPPEMLDLNQKGKKVWDLYQSNHFVNEKVYLDIHYLGMTVGKIMVVNKGREMMNGKEVWHFHARFKSAPFYSSIYELDDTVDTYVSVDEFLSQRYSLIQRESKQDIDDLQLHDRDSYKTFWFYHQKKSDGTIKDKKAEKPIPYFSIDPFSVLFFYQGLPLKDNDVYEIPIINKGKMLVLKSIVEGREKVKTEDGKERKAIRVHATTKYTGETLKSGDLYFWFSDDPKRTLLKAQAKIKIGSVTADIVDP